MDLHILLDDNLTFRESHAISEEVEDAIRRVLPNVDVIVHTEPYHEERRHQMEAHSQDAR
jgi:divalent metal cation (Fe/Co/Zn/Cd) transporter